MLLGWQTIAISKVVKGQLTKIGVVKFPIESGQEYDIQIAARKSSLTSYVDGRLVNQVTDETFLSGEIALMTWKSKTAFRDQRYRLLH